jgi:hypothetical protein
MVGFRESYVLAGCDGHFEDSDEQATYDEVVRIVFIHLSMACAWLLISTHTRTTAHTHAHAHAQSKHLAKYISLFSTGDQDIRSYVIFLLAVRPLFSFLFPPPQINVLWSLTHFRTLPPPTQMCPSQWRLVQPLLDAIARDPTQSLCIRTSALDALSFVAPVRQAEAGGKGEGQSTHADDEAIALARRTVDLLTSFLPPATGTRAFGHWPHKVTHPLCGVCVCGGVCAVIRSRGVAAGCGRRPAYWRHRW